MIIRIIKVILRSILTYIILLTIGRIMGRKLISRITFYDTVVGVTIGAIAVRIALGPEESPILAAISLITITTLVVITDHIDINNFKFRNIVDGEPIVLISNGRILDNNLKKVKITINKLMMQLREKNIFNPDDVSLAIIESDGQLTVLPKGDKKPITTGDLKIQTKDTGLMRDIIIDGKIMNQNLKLVNHDEEWVREQLKSQSVYEIKDVFYAGLNSEGTLYISVKTKQ